ncbi:multicopper oxidase family protein [Streptomyces sp. TS71-3]|uniref:multicopper oxidase family protein n=1 Tax=Streptomyces sp. TS71-3 TaxID=2733862 RepID=UPI0035ABE170
MAITSLNVYAGLAGACLIRDPADRRLGLPEGEFEVPLVLQDRTFNADGSLAYTMTEVDGADTAVVNGKAYPLLAVQPRRYRLRILNGSNERFWRLRFKAGATTLPFWVIGTDGGYRTPVRLESILTSPAERFDVIVDFGQVPLGTNVTLQNFDAPVHYPDGTGPEIPEIMRFQVTERLSGADRSTPPAALRLPAVVPIVPTPRTRRREFVVHQKVVNETITLNGLLFMAPNEDVIENGSTEIWEYIDLQHEGHPMHVHLINFQVVNRQSLDATAYQADYETWLAGGRKPADRPVLEKYLSGAPTSPDPDEDLAYKDTVKIYPATVTRIIMTFDVPGTIASIPGSGTELPATYVHHCHILEHEDNDLMRPWTIVGNGAEGAGGGSR